MTTAVLPAEAPKRRRILLRIADLRAWLFLVLLIVFFEVWAETVYGTTFIANLYNVQSITIFAVAPLLMALGQTLVIISSGIDLSVGFTMGLASVIAAHVINVVGVSLGLPDWLAMFIGIVAGAAVALVPGLVNGWLVARLRVPPFIGTLGMYGIARGAAYLLAGGTTVPVGNDWFAIIGTVAGALVIALIQYGLVFINVAPFWQFVAVGLVIIISVLVDQSQRRLLGGHEDE